MSEGVQLLAMRARLANVGRRAALAALGAAIGAGVGGLFSRSSARTGASVGALVGATVGDGWGDDGSLLARAELESAVDHLREERG